MSELLNRVVTVLGKSPFTDSETTVFVGENLIFITVHNSSCGKIKFSQASVILSMGGVCMAGCMHGRGHASWGHAWWGCMAGDMHGRWRVCIPRETATAADGTHPTGMHSCVGYCFKRRVKTTGNPENKNR